MTVRALRVTGVPVYREGNYFVVPSGTWSIIEACGGVRFLIAALMTGCIFAWLQYRAPIKRIVFVMLALAAALLANWLRAYAIVLMAHFSDNKIGTGADHDWWGWLIFGAPMFVLFSVGMRWTDKEDGSHSSAPDTAGWVAVYTPVGDDIGAGVHRLTSFVEAMSGPIDAALATTFDR